MGAYRSTSAPGNRLGEFLRARREVTSPDGAKVLHSGRRRTPGLRREEVAYLAGVSTDYYIRLEQGRERHPSEQVLDALAEALELDPDGVEHLYRLARPTSRRAGAVDLAEQVSPNLLQLMRMVKAPAVVLGRRMDVLACNAPAAFLYRGLEHSDNLIKLIFLNPAAGEFYRDWDYVARSKTALLRGAAAGPDDPYLLDLIEEVGEKSPEFRRLWARHDVLAVPPGKVHLHHADVGDLTLNYEAFTVHSCPGERLVVYQTEPDSASERALERLGRLAAEIGAPVTEPGDGAADGEGRKDGAAGVDSVAGVDGVDGAEQAVRGAAPPASRPDRP